MYEPSNICSETVAFYMRFLLMRKYVISRGALFQQMRPLIFVENGVEYVCASNCTIDIIATHQRGARIRIVTGRTMAGHKSSMIDELVAVGIPVRINRRHKIEHNKFAVFDNRRMVTGSYN